jgi:hypothetical protein
MVASPNRAYNGGVATSYRTNPVFTVTFLLVVLLGVWASYYFGYSYLVGHSVWVPAGRHQGSYIAGRAEHAFYAIGSVVFLALGLFCLADSLTRRIVVDAYGVRQYRLGASPFMAAWSDIESIDERTRKSERYFILRVKNRSLTINWMTLDYEGLVSHIRQNCPQLRQPDWPST